MENLWTRRTNSSKLSLTTPSNGANGLGGGESGSRSATVRSSHGKSFNTTPGSGLVSPTGGASSAFGLGSGAFASFGSFGSAKTPKSGGNPFDSAMGSAVAKQATTSKDAATKPVARPPNMAPISETKASEPPAGATQIHMLKDAWSFWFRPPISKAHGFIEYENTLHGIATVRSAEEFWQIYSHLKRPSNLPVVSDYHLFKKDIRPIWEDEVNRKGGKWVVRLKKGVADRYWEDLLLSLVGDQFGDAGEDVCGAVLSMRNGEDILSIWTRTDGGRVLKIRETMKQVLNFPANTRLEFKSHDSSIQQRTAIDEQRREKASQHQGEKRHINNSSKQSFE
ncbi:translation initiation factor eIF 4e-like domain-containing protein [Trichoderma austrokoningii]